MPWDVAGAAGVAGGAGVGVGWLACVGTLAGWLPLLERPREGDFPFFVLGMLPV